MMTGLTPEDVADIASEAFVFGFPLVLLDVTRCVMMAEVDPDSGERVGLNRLRHRRTFPDASFTAVVSPNADTLYSTGFLALADEPVVLHLPDSGGRYHLFPLLSAWTDVFASLGTRTTGDGGGDFVVVGPHWSGVLPDGIEVVRAPTSDVFVIGRTQTNGSADYAAVHEFQDQVSLTALSAYLGSPAPTQRPEDPADTTTPPPAQVRDMDAVTYFGRVSRLMVDNPPAPRDAPALARFARIGLSVGEFRAHPGDLDAIAEGMQRGLASFSDLAAISPPAIDGWAMSRDGGTYGTDYLRRAGVALFGLGANLAADSLYPHTDVDENDERLTGARRYVLHFEPGQTPPCRAFWSLTMYNQQQYFVDNPLDRYAIGDRDELVFNDDGSLDIHLQRDSPDSDKVANWLPAPAGEFNLVMRVYWPEPAMADGSWNPPPVRRVDERAWPAS